MWANRSLSASDNAYGLICIFDHLSPLASVVGRMSRGVDAIEGR